MYPLHASCFVAVCSSERKGDWFNAIHVRRRNSLRVLAPRYYLLCDMFCGVLLFSFCGMSPLSFRPRALCGMSP